MLKIANRIISQSATVQTAEQTAAQSIQPQTADPNNVATKTASSENSWQRAGLQQNEIMQKSVLTQKLTSQESYSYQLEQIEKNKEARDEKNGFSSFGSIFLGPLVGTALGDPIAGKSDHENKKDDLRSMIQKESEEIKKLQAELDEVYDSNFVATANWLDGRDEGAEFQEDTNVNQTTAKKLTANPFKDDDD